MAKKWRSRKYVRITAECSRGSTATPVELKYGYMEKCKLRAQNKRQNGHTCNSSMSIAFGFNQVMWCGTHGVGDGGYEQLIDGDGDPHWTLLPWLQNVGRRAYEVLNDRNVCFHLSCSPLRTLHSHLFIIKMSLSELAFYTAKSTVCCILGWVDDI